MKKIEDTSISENPRILILGAGLAGTVLAWHLHQRGQKTILIDAKEAHTSSYAAVGLYNPITGRHWTKTWNAEALFPYLQDFYSQLSHELDVDFFHPRSILKPFASVEEYNTWQGRMADSSYTAWMQWVESAQFPEHCLAPLGGIKLMHSGFVEVGKMVESLRQYFEAKQALRYESWSYEHFQVLEKGVLYKDEYFDQVVFCEGYHAKKNPYFNYLPFRPVKGEVMEVKIEDFHLLSPINQGGFMVPSEKKGFFKVGSTYQWDDLSLDPSLWGGGQLAEKASKIISKPYEKIRHWAGIRPATIDRKPFLGRHPEHPQLSIFNGLGTKGVSLAPLLAHQMCEMILSGIAPDSEVDIKRFAKNTVA